MVVIVPPNLKYTNTSLFYGTGNNNDGKRIINQTNNDDLVVIDTLAHEQQMIAVVGFEMPNSHMIFADDPEQRGRSEDSLLSWTFKRAYEHRDPLQAAICPMTKAFFQCMKAVE